MYTKNENNYLTVLNNIFWRFKSNNAIKKKAKEKEEKTFYNN